MWALAVLVIAAAAGGAYVALEPEEAGAPPVPEAVPLTLSAVRDYDPQGDDQENPDFRGRAIDGDPETAWFTERYFVTPAFGGADKTGVGLILRLTAPAVASEMVISSPTPGAGFQVLGPLVDGRRQELASGTLEGADQVVPLLAADPAEAYVLWITSLVPDEEGAYSAGIGEVQLRGTPNSS